MFLDYGKWKKKFEREIEQLRIEVAYYKNKGRDRPRARHHIAYNGVLLTQLTNGARISEAVEAVLKFVGNKSHEQAVEVRKRKRAKKRIIIIPRRLKQADFGVLRGKRPERVQFNTWAFARHHYGINTHSLRYAFVSHSNKRGVPATMTAHYIRHTNVGMIEHYSRDKEADEYFRKMIK